MFTTNERSRNFELSVYDVKSFLTYCFIIIGPEVLSHVSSIESYLLSLGLSPSFVSIFVTVLIVFLRKFLKNYDLSDEKSEGGGN